MDSNSYRASLEWHIPPLYNPVSHNHSLALSLFGCIVCCTSAYQILEMYTRLPSYLLIHDPRIQEDLSSNCQCHTSEPFGHQSSLTPFSLPFAATLTGQEPTKQVGTKRGREAALLPAWLASSSVKFSEDLKRLESSCCRDAHAFEFLCEGNAYWTCRFKLVLWG